MVLVPLGELLREKAPGRIIDLIARLDAIEEALPADDGVACFTAPPL
jgi:hypothetical protein